jgi:hypothetical protein
VNGPGDDDLRSLFEAARKADEAAAPPFRRVLARRPASRSSILRVALAAAAFAALLAASLAILLARREPQPAVRIAEWKSPTDFLLEAPYPDLLGTSPALIPPIPDYRPLIANPKGHTR